MYDTSKLTMQEKSLLADFSTKRKMFDNYIKNNKLKKVFSCPGCSYPTLTERGSYEICEVCDWEDDYQDDSKADEVWGGPNGQLSLTENRINIGKTLQQMADDLKGQLIVDPTEVLKIVKLYKDKKEAILNKLTGDESYEHPLWTERKQVRKDLQKALVGK